MIALWPAIDLMGGKVVRLLHGDPSQRTVYPERAVDVALRFAREGADGLHVVDLDAAFGTGSNAGAIAEIVAASSVPVEVGGGLRGRAGIEAALASGVSRVVLGSLPFRDPALFAGLLADFGDRLVVALDCKEGRPTVDGRVGDAGAGGGDVVQEWGVVKASLRQRLVIPAVARAPGAAGAFWTSELLLRNPSDEPLLVALRFVPAGGGPPREAAVRLGPQEIRLVPDLLDSVFEISSGSGALFLAPEGTRAVSATSRTSTSSAEGSFGTSTLAVDVFSVASARFPLSFSGALPGSGQRTNVGGVDVAGRGATVGLDFASESGWTGRDDLSFGVPPDGTTQLDRLASWLGVEPWRAGALEYAPARGEVVPFVTSIDERTNDPTSWRPDLPASVVRAIPALVHADGRNGARFRSDLFLYNDTDALTTVTLAAKPWASGGDETVVTLTLLPREAKVVRDALGVVFRQAGVSRLRFVSNGSGAGTGVRVTSRAYTVRPDGGTYGVPLPPLNAFQMAGAGESIELFGALGGPSWRTNLALVEMTPFADGKTVRARVELVGDGGRTLDAFDVNVPVAGGIQLDDVFRARGLGDGPPAALIRVSPAGGLVGAYATSLDQGTNDAVLVPAALAARD